MSSDLLKEKGYASRHCPECGQWTVHWVRSRNGSYSGQGPDAVWMVEKLVRCEECSEQRLVTDVHEREQRKPRRRVGGRPCRL